MDSHDSILSRSQCPRCLDNGRDNLVNYADGHSYCYSCGHTVNGKKPQAFVNLSSSFTMPMHTASSILSKRGISDEVIKSYNVSCEQTDDGQLWIVFPLADTNGSVYSKRRRLIDVSTGTLTREIRSEKGKRMQLPVFGWQLVKKQKTILVCEGETDALIAATHLQGRSDVAVIGLCGSTNAERLAAHLLAYAMGRRVVVAFDNDSAGDSALEKLLSYVEKHESDLNILKLDIPREYNDLGDWVGAQAGVDLYAAVNEAQPVNMLGVLNGDQIAHSLSDYIDTLKSNTLVELKFSPTLSEAVRFLPGKLVGVCGSSGQGKSTLVEHITMEALQQKFKVFVISQEMSPAEYALKLVRMVRHEPLDNPMFLRQLKPETIAEIADQVRRIAKLLNMTDSFGVMEVDKIDQHLHKLTSLGLKPDIVIVDHLLAICKGVEANNIMDVCRDLKELARNHDTCIVLLSHVRKRQVNGKTIYRPQLDDVYGSSGLQMYADVLIAIASDRYKRETYLETVKVERLGGYYADITLKYEDYCLTEISKAGYATDYAEDEEYDSDEEVY